MPYPTDTARDFPSENRNRRERKDEKEPPREFNDAGSLGERGIDASENRKNSTHGEDFAACSAAAIYVESRRKNRRRTRKQKEKRRRRDLRDAMGFIDDAGSIFHLSRAESSANPQ